jgi:signal transduction histidine kinase
VRMYGGDINFRNLPGKGCVFVIDMPAASDTPTGLLPQPRADA